MGSLGQVAAVQAPTMARPVTKPAPATQPAASVSVRPTVEHEERPQDYVAPTAAIAETVSEMNRFLQRTTSLRFRVEENNNDVVVSVVDPENDKVIRQIPSQQMQELATRMREFQGLLFNKQV